MAFMPPIQLRGSVMRTAPAKSLLEIKKMLDMDSYASKEVFDQCLDWKDHEKWPNELCGKPSRQGQGV